MLKNVSKKGITLGAAALTFGTPALGDAMLVLATSFIYSFLNDKKSEEKNKALDADEINRMYEAIQVINREVKNAKNKKETQAEAE